MTSERVDRVRDVFSPEEIRKAQLHTVETCMRVWGEDVTRLILKDTLDALGLLPEGTARGEV